MAEPLTHFGELDPGRTIAQRRRLRLTIASAVVLHAAVLALIIWHPHRRPTRISVAPSGPMTAYVSTGQPAATSGASRPVVSRPRPPKHVMAARVAQPQPASNESPGQSSGETVGTAGGGQGSTGPVRIGEGQIHLLRRVEPIYPPVMQHAGMAGTVVLDAVIRPDGSIDDIKVLHSGGPLFDRAAIDAVKQWQYTPPGVESVLTVTVNFSIR